MAMTFDDVKANLTKIVSNADTALAELPGFLENLKGDYETFMAAIDKNADLENRVRTLQDTNHKLFLMQTGQPTETPEEPELSGVAAMDSFVSSLMDDGK